MRLPPARAMVLCLKYNEQQRLLLCKLLLYLSIISIVMKVRIQGHLEAVVSNQWAVSRLRDQLKPQRTSHSNQRGGVRCVHVAELSQWESVQVALPPAITIDPMVHSVIVNKDLQVNSQQVVSKQESWQPRHSLPKLQLEVIWVPLLDLLKIKNNII